MLIKIIPNSSDFKLRIVRLFKGIEGPGIEREPARSRKPKFVGRSGGYALADKPLQAYKFGFVQGRRSESPAAWYSGVWDLYRRGPQIILCTSVIDLHALTSQWC